MQKNYIFVRINKTTMATYNKRGYKQKKQVEAEISSEEEIINAEDSTTAEVFNSLDEGANKAEEFVEKNQKYIFIIIGVVALVVLGYIGYNQFVAKPQQAEAMNDMYLSQTYFNEAVAATGSAKDSLFNLSLKGNNGKLGMLDVANEYGSTDAGNLAHYYAGMAYLNTKKYKEAVEHLTQFESEDEVLAPLSKGAIGDAFAQLNQKEDALDYYKQAYKLRTNDYTTPTYMYKAGIMALDLGKTDEAISLFEQLKNDYPNATESSNVDVFLGKAQAMKN